MPSFYRNQQKNDGRAAMQLIISRSFITRFEILNYLFFFEVFGQCRYSAGKSRKKTTCLSSTLNGRLWSDCEDLHKARSTFVAYLAFYKHFEYIRDISSSSFLI